MAGQIVMQGFLRFSCLADLGAATGDVLPAFARCRAWRQYHRCAGTGQVVLSIALPVPMIALIYFTSRRSSMGDYVTGLPRFGCWQWAGPPWCFALNFVLLSASFGLRSGSPLSTWGYFLLDRPKNLVPMRYLTEGRFFR